MDRLRDSFRRIKLAQLAISDISGQGGEAIARKREEAIQKKKTKDAARHVECENHTKQKSTQSEIRPAGGKTKKRNIGETEEAEHEVLSKRGKLNGRKRIIVEVEEATQVDSSKRQKSEGQGGCKQLGCSTHKGIS